jgi:hypothetical protein
MKSRGVVVLVFVVISGAVFFLFQSKTSDTVKELRTFFEQNERAAESAPQQQVVATWSVFEAEIAQVDQNGTRNGLLAAGVALLVAIATSLVFVERRDSRRGAPMVAEPNNTEAAPGNQDAPPTSGTEEAAPLPPYPEGQH